MKTLTIKQPWASLIAHGIKDIENRTWPTKYRGKILIHAGAAKFKLEGTPLTLEQSRLAYEGHKLGKIGDADKLPLSAIIGEVDIVDCVINHPSIWAEKNETYIFEETGLECLANNGEKRIYNWVLANPVLYDQPIYNVKGRLSLWEFKNV